MKKILFAILFLIGAVSHGQDSTATKVSVNGTVYSIVGGALDITTSAKLSAIVGDETGSGSLVFSNSPTFVTPDLGTPSSVTLTNATGLPTSGITDGDKGEVTFTSGTITIDEGVINEVNLNATNAPVDNYVLSYNAAGEDFTWVVDNTGGISDGDKGDITVSGSGTVFTVDSLAVSAAKITYDNSYSGLASSIVKGAIDDLSDENVPITPVELTTDRSLTTNDIYRTLYYKGTDTLDVTIPASLGNNGDRIYFVSTGGGSIKPIADTGVTYNNYKTRTEAGSSLTIWRDSTNRWWAQDPYKLTAYNPAGIDYTLSLSPVLYLKPSTIDADVTTDGSPLGGTNVWTDASGNGNDSSIGGGTLNLNIGADSGRQVEFTGGTAWIDLPDVAGLDPTPGTDEFTVVWREGDTAPTTGYYFAKNGASAADAQYQAGINGSILFSRMGNANTDEWTYSSGTANRLFVMIFSTTDITLYIDGVLQTKSTNGTQGTGTQVNSLNIGGRSDGSYLFNAGATMDLFVFIPSAIDGTQRANIEAQWQKN